MVTDKLRKYVLPNIPYVFIGWAFLKLGTAYRLAAGSDFTHKFIGLGQTVGAAFADFAPGLAPFDWLVGIVGMVSRSVAVSSILFSNLGSTKGLMSFSLPHEAFCQVLF